MLSTWPVFQLRRAMVNPEREPLSGLVEHDETIIPFRTKNDPVVAWRTTSRPSEGVAVAVLSPFNFSP